MGHGYKEYVKRVLELSGRNLDSLEVKKEEILTEEFGVIITPVQVHI